MLLSAKKMLKVFLHVMDCTNVSDGIVNGTPVILSQRPGVDRELVMTGISSSILY
jgi:hypothetical protein